MDKLKNNYFNWLCSIVKTGGVTYKKLLAYLHDTNFRWMLDKDENRAADGVALRYRYQLETGCDDSSLAYLGGQCSVLEMMIGLALRCEETIMDDPAFGNRTAQWFWQMIKSMGLNAMHDGQFNAKIVESVVDDFLDRKYAPNGKGGLFTIKNCSRDLRTVEIWYQLCWYLDSAYFD